MYRIKVIGGTYEKIGRGYWLRRCDLINSLVYHNVIAKDDNGYYWVDRKYRILQFSEIGAIEVPLNLPKKEPWKVPVTGMAGSNKVPWMYRYKPYDREPMWITPAPWEDALKIDRIRETYIELYSTMNGRVYFMGIPDYIRATAKGYMSNGLLKATLQYVKYGKAYGIKVKDLWYI